MLIHVICICALWTMILYIHYSYTDYLNYQVKKKITVVDGGGGPTSGLPLNFGFYVHFYVSN